MAHPAQISYCMEVKAKHPNHFKNVRVLDCGSLNINGSNRSLFLGCAYTGIDLGEGDNVHFVSTVHEYPGADEHFDTIISTEMLEHDRHWKLSLASMLRMLKPGGLLLLTCASGSREEHGTAHHHSGTSPFTQDYYGNRSKGEISSILKPTEYFREHAFSFNSDATDLYFHGIKFGENVRSEII